MNPTPWSDPRQVDYMFGEVDSTLTDEPPEGMPLSRPLVGFRQER